MAYAQKPSLLRLEGRGKVVHAYEKSRNYGQDPRPLIEYQWAVGLLEPYR